MPRPRLSLMLCGAWLAAAAASGAWAQERTDPRAGAPAAAGAPASAPAPSTPPAADDGPGSGLKGAPEPAAGPLVPAATPASARAAGAGPASATPAEASAAPPAPAAAAPPAKKPSGKIGDAKVEAEPAPAKAEPPKPPPSGMDEAFEVKVKSLEETVSELKEKIFRTKARLLLLQETVLGGDITAGAKAVLVHKNDMGASFVLESVSYALDGAPIFTRADDTGELDKKKEIEIFNGRIVPGNHQVSVKLQYRGSGFGVFSYLEAYKFKVQSSHTFNAEGGKVTTIKIVGFEKGNITTDLKDRPAVKYDVEVARDQVKRAAAEAAPSEGRPQ